jgi:hypothetical protein
MNLEDFAKKIGCVVSFDPQSGGKWSYQIAGDTSVTYTGFRSESLACNRFLENRLGKLGVKELGKLLKKVERLEKSNKELRSKL